ncbi:MAG: type I DNA topoisomerase [Lachnospiraceae bacterium]|nr:type I DNA topoisomerase [Lachnospiraceae bacterium]
MAKNLVIVESPAKAKTIQKFLGSNYTVVASGGHVRDLPVSKLGVDVEDGSYEPKYITIRGKGEVLAQLRKEVKKANKIYLATDPDREGEAISWHLKHVLKLEDKNCYRITFNEITKNAVKNSIANARDIDMNLVDSQQCRRILDRFVGYMISPLLWAKVKRGLSAGRVQSVVLRLIADREDEIAEFKSTEYWSVEAGLRSGSLKKPIEAKLTAKNGEKISIANALEAEKILSDLEKTDFVVSEVKKSERTNKAPLPFTTSTLQQEASKVLGFSTVKTMRVAQQLYEGVKVKSHGTIGLISYLRTDSVRISEEAAAFAASFIENNYGKEYADATVKSDKDKKRIQDAHEAIRPTYVDITPASVKDELTREQFRLYQLIWKRFVASQMASAKIENASITINAGEYEFKSSASRVLFEGYLSVYNDNDEDKKMSKQLHLPSENEVLEKIEIKPEQHFTQPPAHYTEASMVKTMEELGIGRPSTYAPTISLLLARHYIMKEKKNLYMTEIGEAVNNIMKKSFPTIVATDFTASLETLLDGVEAGAVNWKSIVENFYPDFNEAVKIASEEIENIEIQDEVSEEICDVCGRNMVIKYGPHGKFLACPGFPECKNTKTFLEKTGISCPNCGGELVIRKTKKGRRYFGCEKYPDCDFMSWQKPQQNG